MLLAMSMVAMVVVLMAFAVYAVIAAALYSDIDNQLDSRAQLLIASGSLAADPAKAIEGTAYSDVNAMLVNPGHSIYTAQQPGQTLPVDSPEKAVIRGGSRNKNPGGTCAGTGNPASVSSLSCAATCSWARVDFIRSLLDDGCRSTSSQSR